jgi:uncharacterized membrane protein
MSSEFNMEKIAEYAFLAFIVIAIVAGIAIGYMAWAADNDYPYGFYDSTVADYNSYVLLIMLVLGIIIGLISIATTEVAPFLMSAIALIVASIAHVWDPLERIHAILPYWATAAMNYLVAFVAPAAVILAIKAVYALARKK